MTIPLYWQITECRGREGVRVVIVNISGPVGRVAMGLLRFRPGALRRLANRARAWLQSRNEGLRKEPPP